MGQPTSRFGGDSSRKLKAPPQAWRFNGRTPAQKDSQPAAQVHAETASGHGTKRNRCSTLRAWLKYLQRYLGVKRDVDLITFSTQCSSGHAKNLVYSSPPVRRAAYIRIAQMSVLPQWDSIAFLWRHRRKQCLANFQPRSPSIVNIEPSTCPSPKISIESAPNGTATVLSILA